MNGRICVVITSEKDLNDLKLLYSKMRFSCLMTVPELIQFSGVFKSFVGGKFDIIALVDYPKGSKFSCDKFKGVSSEFFLVDGYDITLSIEKTASEVCTEIKEIYTFIRQMIGENLKIIYTLSMAQRDHDSIGRICDAINSYPPNYIKLESLTTLQPTKANLEVHQSNIELLKRYTSKEIIICGNIHGATYDKCPHPLAVSPKQFKHLIEYNQNKISQK